MGHPARGRCVTHLVIEGALNAIAGDKTSWFLARYRAPTTGSDPSIATGEALSGNLRQFVGRSTLGPDNAALYRRLSPPYRRTTILSVLCRRGRACSDEEQSSACLSHLI
jgi:hypothetical protein